MRRRIRDLPGSALAPAGRAQLTATAQPPEGGGHGGIAGNGPVVVLSYAHSGADRVQAALTAGTGLACTSGTGIIPLCAAAAESWRRVEGRSGDGMSRLAMASIRGLVNAQVTTILAGAGQSRWCELATPSPGAAESFHQVFPGASFVCVHRSCLDVVRAAARASPWGLHGQGLLPYLLAYPGNNVAALAAYWASSAEQLLAFEQANPETTYRIRYEDVTAYPDQALTAVRAALQLGRARQDDGLLTAPRYPEPGSDPEAEVPAEMLPEPLRLRISSLHAQLGYPPPAA